MKKLSTAIMGIALLSAVIYTGCKKDSTSTGSTVKDNDATAAQDEANASFVINDSKTIADGGAKGQLTNKPFSICGNVTRRDTVIGGYTDTLVDIYFSGLCPDASGRYRKGHVLVYWHGTGYFDSTASITQTWSNYSVTSMSGNVISVVNGSYSNFSNTGKDTAGDHSWKYSSNVTLNYSTGGSSSWVASRNNVLTKINNVWYYVVTGSATGTSKSGGSFTLSITSPLYYTAYWVNTAVGNSVCGCIEAGTLQFTRTGKTYPLILTYTSGIGNCNYTATATINGTNYNILVP